MELSQEDFKAIENRRAHALELARINAEFIKKHNIKNLGEWNNKVLSIRQANRKAN